MNKLQQKKEELQQLIQKYNEVQQTLNQIGQQILKVQGSIETLEELEKENKLEKK